MNLPAGKKADRLCAMAAAVLPKGSVSNDVIAPDTGLRTAAVGSEIDKMKAGKGSSSGEAATISPLSLDWSSAIAGADSASLPSSSGVVEQPTASNAAAISARMREAMLCDHKNALLVTRLARPGETAN